MNRKSVPGHLKNFFDASLDMLCVADSRKLKFVNPAWTKTLGYSEKELLTKEFYEFIHPDDLEATRKVAENLLKGKDAVYFVNRWRGKSGKIIWMSWKAHYDKKQKLIFAIARDITGRKKIEDRLEKHEKQLEETVKKRTAALTRANKELEKFAHIASHDLQEPLRTISSYAQLINAKYSDSLDEDGRIFIKYLTDAAANLRELVGDLLVYSEPETEKRSFGEVDCNLILKTVILNLQSMVEESGAKIKTGKLPIITGDKTQIAQLFQNLISNAIKYRNSKKPEIKIGVRIFAEKNKGFWMFHCQDNGIGIQKKYCKKIFESFKRIHGKEKYPGSGLGLSICKKVVENHGGKIWVESVRGKGSVFYFTIPK